MSLPSKAEARHHRAFPEEFWRTAASCTWQQCWMGSSSSHISGGHWNEALASMHVVSPENGSFGQVPNQHWHAAPAASQGVLTLGQNPRIVNP